MRTRGALALGVSLLALAACSDSPAGPGGKGACGPLSLTSGSRVAPLVPSFQVSAAAALSPFQAITADASELPSRLTLAEDSATYVVVPHFATGTGPKSSIAYVIGANAVGTQVAAGSARVMAGTPLQGESALSVQRRFDAELRSAERQLAPGAPQEVAQWRVSANVVPSAAVAPPKVGSTRQFKVLATLDPKADKFETVNATLRFAGCNILIYVDQAAPAAPRGFSDAQLTAFGKLFDQDLYGIDVRAFGEPSDIDGNGRVVVLLTPTVNKLTPTSDCSTGYVAGFFYGLDLLPTRPNSNKGEVFYSMVPDPDGTFGCAHPLGQVEATTPATFVHELQHMISWNQHVILRKGLDEDLWLNEALSHIAEELGSRYYEEKYPTGGRENPRQIFPDSSQKFIGGVLFDSYSYLLNPSRWSITEFIEGGTVEERGGAWLFLRWLGDQKGSGIYKNLVQTGLTGIANVEAQAGEKFPALFGDFTLALYTDSLPGVSRSSMPQRYRFASRNLRMLYDALYRGSDDRVAYPRRFPLELKTLPAPGSRGTDMVPGTADFFRVQMPKSDAGAQSLRFSQSGGATFDAALKAQATVFRCPSATACPATIAP